MFHHQINNSNIKICPLLFYNNLFYFLDEDYKINIIEELDNIIDKENCFYFFYNTKDHETFFEKYCTNEVIKNCIDLEFIEYIIKVQGKEKDYEIPFLYISQYKEFYYKLLNERYNNDLIKHALLCLLQINQFDKLFNLYKKYKIYYETIIIKVLYNLEVFKKNKLYINNNKYPQLETLFNEKYKYIKFNNGNPYYKIEGNFYTQKTNRISLNTNSLTKEQKEVFIPQNDILLEIDSSSSEFRLLLYLNNEIDKYEILNNKNTFWFELGKLLNAEMFDHDMKMCMYLMMYGSNKETIAKKCSTEPNKIYKIKENFRKVFPNSYAFYSLEKTNKYISKTSEILYDLFNREIYEEENYKKLSIFLQSSFSTIFQLLTYNIITEFKNLKLESKILYTVHDSFVLDLKLEERNEVFEIIRKNAYYNDFKLLLKINR